MFENKFYVYGESNILDHKSRYFIILSNIYTYTYMTFFTRTYEQNNKKKKETKKSSNFLFTLTHYYMHTMNV